MSTKYHRRRGHCKALHPASGVKLREPTYLERPAVRIFLRSERYRCKTGDMVVVIAASLRGPAGRRTARPLCRGGYRWGYRGIRPCPRSCSYVQSGMEIDSRRLYRTPLPCSFVLPAKKRCAPRAWRTASLTRQAWWLSIRWTRTTSASTHMESNRYFFIEHRLASACASTIC